MKARRTWILVGAFYITLGFDHRPSRLSLLFTGRRTLLTERTIPPNPKYAREHVLHGTSISDGGWVKW